MIKPLLMLFLLLSIAIPAFTQNKCTELRKELELLEKRVRDIKKELSKDECGAKTTECAEIKNTHRNYEIKVGCNEIKGSTLRINFQIKHSDIAKPNHKALFDTDGNKAFDQNGKMYISNKVKVGDIVKEQGALKIEMVYDTWYPGYVEFFIGKEPVNLIKLFQLDLGQLIDFQNLDVRIK